MRKASAFIALLLTIASAGCAGSPDIPDPSTPPPSSPTAPASCERPATADQVGLRNGLAFAPTFPPTTDKELLAKHEAIRRIIAAGNEIAKKPYRYGGGHRPFADGLDSGYDASGAVSWALHGADLLSEPLSSSALTEWGVKDKPDEGSWLTVYANAGNVFLELGRDHPVRLSTSASYRDRCALPGSGPRWSAVPRSVKGYVPRYAPGL